MSLLLLLLLSVIKIAVKDGYEGRLEAASICDLFLFGQGNLILIT